MIIYFLNIIGKLIWFTVLGPPFRSEQLFLENLLKTMVSNNTVNDFLILYPDCFGGTVRISTSIHESNKYSDVAFAAVILLLGPATGMLNLLTLLAIFKNRNLQTVLNTYTVATILYNIYKS